MSTTAAHVASPIQPTTPGPVKGTPNTPLIKAVPSKIFTKSTPTLPPPADCYEPLVKSLFRHRLQLSLLHSAAYTYVVTILWSLWQAGGFTKVGLWGALWIPINPWTLSMTLFAWTSLAVPVTVLRKVFLTPQRLVALSPLSTVTTSLSQKSTRVATVVHVISSLCALLLHVLNEYSYAQQDPKLTIFVISRKHPHYLNGRLVFLVFTQSFTALAFVLRGALSDRFVFRWAVATTNMKHWTALLVLVATLVSLVTTTLAVSTGLISFGLARMSLPIFCNLPVISAILRPFTAHFLRGRWTITLPFYHIGLVARAASLSFSTFLIWEITDNMFDQVTAERATLSVSSKDPNTTLISGVSSTNQIFKFFAYSELRDLATEESPQAVIRRTSLFGDQKLNLWACLVRESLLLLGHHYQLLLRRGVPPAPASTLAPATTKVLPGPEVGTPTKLLRESIYKGAKGPPAQAALDALSSEGPIAQALDAGASASHIPEIFRSVENKILASPATQEAKKNVEHVKGAGNILRDNANMIWTSFATIYIPDLVKKKAKQVFEWWKCERLSRKVEASLAFRELDVVVIDVLSYLICTSLVDDQYGVVQRDIPRTLEAMVSLLTAIEEYAREIDSQAKKLRSEPTARDSTFVQALAVEVTKSKEILSYVENSLREGIARIVRTFGNKLLAFKFPPPIAQKLQSFVEFA